MEFMRNHGKIFMAGILLYYIFLLYLFYFYLYIYFNYFYLIGVNPEYWGAKQTTAGRRYFEYQIRLREEVREKREGEKKEENLKKNFLF
jgi:hypothetical protein